MGKTARSKDERALEAAEGYLALDMPDHALRELVRLNDPDASRPALYALRGEALRQKEDWDQALKAYETVLADDPADVSVLMGMSWCYKRTDRLSRAIEATEQAYEAAPEEPIVLYNLACYHALNGDKSQALSWLGRALRMESSLRKLIPNESDFDRLRNDPDFQFVAQAHDAANET